MAYEDLKAAIKQAIKQNNNQEITGDLLQDTLLSIVNAIEAGITSGVSWTNITNKPSTFTPSGHTHSTSNIDGLSNYVQSIKVDNATNADKAKQLAIPRLIWGQSFDGTNNINGDLYIGSAEDDSIRLTNKGLVFFGRHNSTNNAYYKKDSIGLYDIANDQCCAIFDFIDSTLTFDPGRYSVNIVFNSGLSCYTDEDTLNVGTNASSGFIYFYPGSTMTFKHNNKEYSFNVAKAIEQGILTI